MTHIKGPDFPTGCTILGTSGIREYMETGHGGVRIRGKAEIVQNGQSRAPDHDHRDSLRCESRPELQEEDCRARERKDHPEIAGVRNESDENSRLVVDLKKDARAQVVLNNLYKHTELESSFSVHMLAIDGNRPACLSGSKDAISCYIEHRREVIIRRTKFLLGKAEVQAEKLEAFLLALGHLDDFIKIIRDSRNRDEARANLKAYTFSIPTAEHLWAF